MTNPKSLTVAELDALDDDATTIAPFRIDERPLCGCERGADPCSDPDHDLLVPDRVLTDGPIGALVVMDDLRTPMTPELAELLCRVVNAAPAMLAMARRTEAAERRVVDLETALTKISAIRDSIVGCQGFNFSEHAYPLVAALDAAGFKGAGYEIARANLGTLLGRNAALEAELRNVLASAHPNERDHPSMSAAWAKAESLLAALRKGG